MSTPGPRRRLRRAALPPDPSPPFRVPSAAGVRSILRRMRRALARAVPCLALPALVVSQAFAQTTPSLTVTPAVVATSGFYGGGTVALTLTPVNRTFLAAGGGANQIPGNDPAVAALLDLSSITPSNSTGPIDFSAAGLTLITLSGAPAGLAIDSGRLLRRANDHRSAEIVLSYSGTVISAATTVTVNVGAALIRGANRGRGRGTSGPALSSTFTITPTTEAGPAITIAPGAGVTEGSPATYTLTATPPPAADLTVNYRVADAPGADFVASGDQGTGRTATLTTSGTATISVPTAADAIDEPSGSVTVTVTGGTGYTPGSTATASVTVTDNDPTTVTLSGPAGNVREGGSKVATLAPGRAPASGETLTAPLVLGGTATRNTDYRLACAAAAGVACSNLNSGNNPRAVFTGPSAASVAITVSALADAVAESTPEAVDIGLGAVTTTGLDGTAVVTDNLATFHIEDPGVITVSPTALSVIEGNPAKGYTVVLGSDPGAAVAVTATSGDGAAQVRAGGAFGSSVTLNFTHGPTGDWGTAQTVEVRATPNDGDTADESVSITHASTVSGNTNHRFHGVTIDPVSVAVSDSGGLPAVRLARGTFPAGEEDGTVTVTVSKTGNAAAEVSYATSDNTATAPADYAATSGVLTWAANDTADRTFTVPIVDDSAAEGTENFRIDLSAPDDSMPPTLLGSPRTGFVAIADNETVAELTVAGFGSTTRVLEGGRVPFGATLSSAPSNPVTIPVRVKSTSGVGAGEVSIPAGSLVFSGLASASRTLSVLADHLAETDETLVVEVHDLPGGITLAAGTSAEDSIVVEDVTNLLLAAPAAGTVTEGSTRTLTVELSENAPSGGVSVPVVLQSASTAAAADVMLPTIAVAAGASTGTGTFTAVDDNLHEGAERAVLAVGAVSGYTTAQTDRGIDITDNDAAPAEVTLSVSPSTVSEGAGSTAVTVTATVGGATRWDDAQTVRVSAAGSGGASVVGFAAVADFDLVIPVGADSGAADFNLVPTDDAAETGDETVTVSGALTGVTVASAALTLTDDDASTTPPLPPPPPTTVPPPPGTGAPAAASAIGPQRVDAGAALTLDLRTNFTGDSLAFAARPARPAIAGAEVGAGRTLTIRGVRRGVTAVTVTATDRLGRSAAQTFRVTVGGTALLPLLPRAADPVLQGFVRVINHSAEDGVVTLTATDDDGAVAGPVTLALQANGAAHFNSRDLEDGNPGKGLSGGVGPGQGHWRLALDSELDFEALAYIRTGDGFLTAMHDTAPVRGGAHHIAFLNPASNAMQISRLRIVNPGDARVEVIVEGVDDAGISGGAVVAFIPPGRAANLTASDLERGTGMDGALGDGQGKWRLRVTANEPVVVMSLLSGPTGHLTNLSTAPATRPPGEPHVVPLFPSASDPLRRQGFLRVVNRSGRPGSVAVDACDDGGTVCATATLALEAGRTRHFNSDDLELGNPGKGLATGTGPGAGDWRLALSSDLDIEVLAYVRTGDGFVTSMHDVAPDILDERHVAFLNPASNLRQVSLLRLANPGGEDARVTVAGTDSGGRAAGSVALTVPAGTARALSAADLETGAAGLDGALGDGDGKWRLAVASDRPVMVMSLLSSPTGHLTNLSTAPDRGGPPAGWVSPATRSSTTATRGAGLR